MPTNRVLFRPHSDLSVDLGGELWLCSAAGSLLVGPPREVLVRRPHGAPAADVVKVA